MGKRSNGTRGTNSSSASNSRKASGGVSELDRRFPNWNINQFISKTPYGVEEAVIGSFHRVYGKKYSLSQEVGDIDKTFKELGEDVYVDINSSINTPQDFLNKQDVAKYMSSRNYDGIKALRYTDGNSERIMIVDGNHRFVAAKLNHERKVKMRIIE